MTKNRLVKATGITVLSIGLLMAGVNANSYQVVNDTMVSAATASLSKVMLKLDGKISGKYTYYYTGKELRRTKDGIQTTKLTDKITGDFFLDESYIYYVEPGKNYLYRMNKNGTNKTRLAKYTSYIVTVQNGWVLYRNTSGATCSIRTNGKDQSKLLSNSQSYNKLITDDCIYYTTYVAGDGGYTTGYKLMCIDLYGNNKKTILKKNLTADISNVFSFAAYGDSVYFASGDAIYQIGADQKIKKIFTSEEGHCAVLSSVTENGIYICDRLADETNYVLQQIGTDGTVSTLIDFSMDQIYFQGDISLKQYGSYYIASCRGDESPNYFYLLDQYGTVIQEIPSTCADLERSYLEKAEVVGAKIYVKYTKGSKSIYKSYKIKNA